jgi:mono/diheme cytochrome c family protein
MFKKFLKWSSIVLAGLIVLAALGTAALYAIGNGRLTKNYSVQPEVVEIPTDQASIQAGQKLATNFCTHCHGEDFSGKALIDDAQVGYVPAPNLTPGEGGAGGEFTDADWIRALRHGIDPEGRALIGMPSQNYYYMSDQDLGDLIAYLKSVAPVNHELGEPAMSFMGKVLLAAGAFGENILPAESIQHNGTRPAAVAPGVNTQYGEYLVRLGGCRDCHGQELAGGKSPEPGAHLASNLTPGGDFAAWSQETFITAMRTNRDVNLGMPWQDFAHLTDDEIKAIFLYLQSLPVMKDAR